MPKQCIAVTASRAEAAQTYTDAPSQAQPRDTPRSGGQNSSKQAVSCQSLEKNQVRSANTPGHPGQTTGHTQVTSCPGNPTRKLRPTAEKKRTMRGNMHRCSLPSKAKKARERATSQKSAQLSRPTAVDTPSGTNTRSIRTGVGRPSS